MGEDDRGNHVRMSFRAAKQLIQSLQKLGNAFDSMYAQETVQETEIREACETILLQYAGEALSKVPVEELKNSRSGIRISALQEAGYQSLEDIRQAKDWELMAVSGIGEKQVESIRNIISRLCSQIIDQTPVRLSADDNSPENDRLIAALARYRKCSLVREDAVLLHEEIHDLAQQSSDPRMIRGRLGWIFSGREKKQYTQETAALLLDFCAGPRFVRAENILSVYGQAAALDAAQARADFMQNAAGYYALLEKISGKGISKERIYSGMPAQLAAQIDEQELDLRTFKGDLRAYQVFGAKYILHQKRVLLGDEMGLGKTIQAIAAMADVHAKSPESHFLIVCPASVLVNWCRELKKFSAMEIYLLHGQFLDEAFAKWEKDGGAAVTNYEMMGRLTERIDNRMHLAMLVIDEAHYIKNPDAKRTRYIHALENESERILLMTGTPLENKVDEMCALVDFVRPDMGRQVREAACMTRIPQFRQMLSPVYLRRQRSQVLEELPPVIMEQEWCRMTAEDLACYQTAVYERSFVSMRRVSFLQDELSTSSKALRLMQLCHEAVAEGRKVLVYSFFRETLEKAGILLQDICRGSITGSVPPQSRQTLIDRFAQDNQGGVLLCQVQAGGTGLNIQAASVVIFCEPQIKPSLMNQAISRVYRMGQVRNVLVYQLLCEDTVDEAVMQILDEKQVEFDAYADESAIASAVADIVDAQWIRQFIENENRKYLPAVVEP